MTDLHTLLGISPTLSAYLVASLGSLMVEVGAVVRQTAADDGYLPKRYKRLTFPLFRIAFAFLGAGPLAIFFGVPSELMALYVGVSAPLLYDRLAAGIVPSIGNGSHAISASSAPIQGETLDANGHLVPDGRPNPGPKPPRP
jgi:hypothetical protein